MAGVPRQTGWIRRFGLLAGPLAAVLLLAFCDFDPEQPAVGRTAALAAWMALWWITEAIPLPATALLPLVLLPALGVMDGGAVASEYFNHVLFLFLGGFIVALAIERWGLHRRIALRTLLVFGTRPIWILLGVLLTTAGLSMWISNTATAMMMVTIVLALVLEMEATADSPLLARYATGLLLAVAYGASIGGLATLVGTPPNLSFARIFERTFPEAPPVTFTTWLGFGVPVALALLAVTWALLCFRFAPRRNELIIDRALIRRQLADLGPASFEERVVFADFMLLVTLWITRQDLALGGVTLPGWERWFPVPGFLNDGTVAVALALVLFAVPARGGGGARIVDWHTAKKLPWGIILLFGGGFALATAFRTSGLSAWLGAALRDSAPAEPVALLGALCLGVTFLTELTSNTATAEMLLPVVAGLARAIGTDPLLLMVPVTLSCSCAFMMPVATPPNAIVFGSERVRIADMVTTGLVLNLAGVLVIGAATLLLGPLVFGIELAGLPAWAR